MSMNPQGRVQAGQGARRQAPARRAAPANRPGARSGSNQRRPRRSAPPQQPQGRRKRQNLVRRTKVRRADLVIAKVDTWSVAKLVFLLSIAVGIVTVVASMILWLFLQATGAFNGLNQLLSSLGTGGNSSIDIAQMVSLGQVALATTVIAVINTVIFTLLGMISAILYNLAAKLVGGITLTMKDE